MYVYISIHPPSLIWTAIAMDFLYLDSVFQVLICTRCQYAIVPGTLAEHLRTLHKKEVSKAELKTCIEFWKD
jgi:hypothetical protein